ncbi:MAG: hypothetical protein R2778_17145 [Saprospiraceae bacterium]
MGLQLDPVSPLCFGQSNGLITLSGISGGAGTFSLLLNGNPIGLVDTLPFIIPNLASGTYTTLELKIQMAVLVMIPPRLRHRCP